MFGLQAQLAPKLNGIQVGFPYVMQFMMERNKQRLAEAAAKPAPAAEPTAETATPTDRSAAELMVERTRVRHRRGGGSGLGDR